MGCRKSSPSCGQILQLDPGSLRFPCIDAAKLGKGDGQVQFEALSKFMKSWLADFC